MLEWYPFDPYQSRCFGGRRGAITMTSRLTALALRRAMNEGVDEYWIVKERTYRHFEHNNTRPDEPISVLDFIREDVSATKWDLSWEINDPRSCFHSQLRSLSIMSSMFRYDKGLKYYSNEFLFTITLFNVVKKLIMYMFLAYTHI